MGDNQLKLFRDQIDSIDKEIFKLLEKRLNLSVEIKNYKTQMGLELQDSHREQVILKKIAELPCSDKIKSIISDIYRSVLDGSLKQMKNPD